MDQVRWEEIKRVLGEALELEDQGQRARFLKKTCAHDTALRREVESLLSRPTDRWEQVAEEVRSSRLASAGPTNQRMGAYVILRELGRGGMGAVYLARRDDREFQKEVAIKLLKRGTDTAEVLRRFRAERDILARLEHPNIARLLDGGTTDDGLPYFIMEYVKGVPLNEFLAAKRLGIDEKLQLFLKICAAVRFAHQNLVVHRDLKPANILVDEAGEPKLLDFGIAKLLAPGEHAFDLTILDQQRLTPAYASPEQVLGEPITTVSDVYSLGALFYEILSECPAHTFSTVHPAPTELRRVVVERDIARPSVVTRDAWTARRLRGDLDNISLKALRKEPERRYGGVGDFAEDIRRYLDHRPIRARRVTLLYRTSKLWKRNKVAVVAAGVVMGTLVVGTVITTREARDARYARARAERRFNDLRKVANSFMLELNSAIKDLPGSLRARQLLTSRALEYLDSLALEAGDDLSLKNELATAYEKLGLVTFDVQQALATHRKAANLNEQLVQADPSHIEYRLSLSRNYANLSDILKIAGNSQEAISYARKAVSQANEVSNRTHSLPAKMDLASCYASLDAALGEAGYYHEAVEAAKANVRIREEISAKAPGDRDQARELGEAYGALSDDLEATGDLQSASALEEKVMTLTGEMLSNDPTSSRNQRDMWAAELRKAGQLADAGDAAHSESAFRDALQLIRQLSKADPSDRGHRYWTAATLLAFGKFELQRDAKSALDSFVRAIEIDENLYAEDPNRVEVQCDLVRLYLAAGEVSLDGKADPRALELFLKARSLGDSLSKRDPSNLEVKAGLAEVELAMGDFFAKRPAPEENRKAREHYENSAVLWRTIRDRGELRDLDVPKLDRAEAEVARRAGT